MNKYIKIATELKDCFVLKHRKFTDDRGYFESIAIDEIQKLVPFNSNYQINNSKSSKGVIRGLHYQLDPYCQSKIVRCIEGNAIDVVVDVRKDSATYGKWVSVELTPNEIIKDEETGKEFVYETMLYVPRGFAHGFIALEDNTIFSYIVDNQYKPDFEGGILWNDSDINIPWQKICEEHGIDFGTVTISDKDKVRLPLKDTLNNFRREPKRFLITGSKGQLGYDIQKELLKLGIDEKYILAIDKDLMDITNQEQVNNVINTFKPDIIFHCAAYTAVDKAETTGKLDCSLINTIGTQNIAEAANKIDAKLIYISTDYVFDGTKEGIYQVDDNANPQNIYGLTKYLGELEVKRCKKSFVVRTSWVFGINGGNFIKTMLRVGENKDKVTVVDDQIGSPTYTVDLANLLVKMAFTDKYGTYHVNNEGYCSWAEFCKYFYQVMGYDTEVKPVSTEKYYEGKDMSTIASRPMNSKLDKSKLDEAGFDRLPSWEDATSRYCLELKNSPIWDTFRK